MALNNSSIISVLNLSQFKPAASSHNFQEELNTNHQNFSSPFKQGMVGISLDELVYKWEGIEFPNQIKIDVDGNEYKIIDGMQKILEDKRLKSLSIEVNFNLDTDEKIKKTIVSKGFKLLESDDYINRPYLEKANTLNLFFARS